jgi:hypothetical protein
MRMGLGMGLQRRAAVVVPSGPTSTQWRLLNGVPSVESRCGYCEIELAATVGGANQCSGGTASADSVRTPGTEDAAYAFDGIKNSLANNWRSNLIGANSWIAYTFASAVSVAHVRMWASYGGRAPVSFELQYWNGSAWVTVLNPTGLTWVDLENKNFTV